MDEKKTETAPQKKSIWQRWKEWCANLGMTRPETTASWGTGMDKISITLPKSVYAQMKLVNMKNAMADYPHDYQLKEAFLKQILPLTTFCGKPVESPDELGYARTEVLIDMYCDLLLAPLSQRAQDETSRTILQILPTLTESDK